MGLFLSPQPLSEQAMTDLTALKAANERRWASAKVLKPGTFTQIARHLVAPNSKQRYLTVSAKIGVPWAFIAVIYKR
jgi:lysozyme family protein